MMLAGAWAPATISNACFNSSTVDGGLIDIRRSDPATQAAALHFNWPAVRFGAASSPR